MAPKFNGSDGRRDAVDDLMHPHRRYNMKVYEYVLKYLMLLVFVHNILFNIYQYVTSILYLMLFFKHLIICYLLSYVYFL